MVNCNNSYNLQYNTWGILMKNERWLRNENFLLQTMRERERERDRSMSLFFSFTLHYHISCYKISVMCLSIRPLLFSTKQYGSAYSQRSILHFCWYIYFKGLVNILLRIVGLRKLLKRFLFLLTLMASQFGCERFELRI